MYGQQNIETCHDIVCDFTDKITHISHIIYSGTVLYRPHKSVHLAYITGWTAAI